MKYIRRHNLNVNNILDDVILQRADGNIEFNPTQRVIINGDLEFPPGSGVPGPEVSNIMYVTVDGNDDNTGYGEGPTQAKRTIKSACEAAVPGTTIFVRSGEYYEDNPIRVPPKVSIVGDNLRRTILYPKNGPLTFNATNVEKTNQIVTITTAEEHGLKPRDRIRVRVNIGSPVAAGNFIIGKQYRILLLGTTDFTQIGSPYNTRGTPFTATAAGQGTGTAYFAEVDETDVNVLEVIDENTFTYRQSGEDIPSTPAAGKVLEGIDFFYCNSAAYIAQVVFKGLRAPAYCVNIDSDAIVDTSPYIQNCSNINGPWMRNGEEWIPFQTKQPDLSGTFVSGPRPLLDNEIDPSQVDVYGIDIEGAGSGCLVDGDRYSPLSPIKSMVGDAFTQIAQGAIGFHITNFGYMQIVSCFAVFCSKAFYATKGGYLSLSNSVIDFGTQGFVADGYYLDPYSVGKMPQDYYSTAGSITVLNEGRGYIEEPTVTIEPPNPLIPGARQATATASIDPIRGTINAISVDDGGYGYDFVPEVTIAEPTGANPIQATALVNLQKNLSVLVSKLANKPQVGSIMLLGDDPQAYYIASTIGSFVAFDYDEVKCRRDAEIILDGIYYDVALNTNYNAVINGSSYRRAMASEVIDEQLEQTIGAINFLKSRSSATLSSDSTAQTRSNSAFDEIIDIVQNGINQADPLVFPSPTGVDTNKEHARDQLIANREFIQAEIIAWIGVNYPLLSYNATTCARDIGYIVDGLCYDVIYGGNSATIVTAKAYFEGAVSVLPEDQKEPTAASFARLSEICQQIVQEQAVVASVGNALLQDVTGSPASATEATQVLNLVSLIESVIIANSTSGLPAPTKPLVGWVNPLTLNAINQLNSQIPQIIEEMIDYIDLNYVTPFKYDQQKCRRDVGIILDAVLADAVFNSNHRAAYAGISYLGSTASKVTSLQKSQTIDALIRAKDVTVALTTLPELQNKIIDGFATVINIINLGESVIPAIAIPPTPVREAGYAESASILLANKTFVQDEIVAWINLNYPRFSYNEEKCSRDVGLILNAVVDDIVFDSNYRAITAGLSYLRSYASEVTQNQRNQTIKGIERARDLAISLISNDQVRQEIEDRFEIIIDIIEDANDSSVPILILTDTVDNPAGNSSIRVLQANREFLRAEVIAWINYQIINNIAPFDSSFRYNRTKCSRDIGYIIDALSYDLIYGGNSQTKHAAETYYIGATSIIEGQEVQSAASFDRLKEIISDVIQNNPIVKTPGNNKTQNTSLPPGTGGAGTTLEGLIDIVTDVVIDGETSVVTVPPTYTSGIEYVKKNYVRTTILAAETGIRNSVIDYLNTTFAAPLDEVNTRKDLNFVIDGIAYDLTYEGNLATSTAAAAYGDGSVIKSVLVESRESQKYFKSIIGKILKNQPITPTAGNLTPQDLSLPLGSPVNSEGPTRKAESLLQIVIHVIENGTGVLPDPVLQPEYSNGDPTYLAERNNILLSLEYVQDETIEYLNQQYGGQITVETFPPIQAVEKDTIVRFHNVSTVSTGATAMEYVGAGVTYNALPFFGGEPVAVQERIEINNGKCFTVTSDQIGNYRIGEFFTVNALTGEITIDAEKLNLSGLASIGPFRRNGIPVGVALREVSNNPNLIASTGSQDGNTAPTQQAVATYVENRYLNKVSPIAQSVESDVTFVGDIDINGGDIRTSQPFFNLINDTAEVVNAFGAATTLNFAAETGTTTINNDLQIGGSVISSPQLTVDIVNSFTETINLGSEATEINIGAETGVLTIRNSTVTLDNASLLSMNGPNPVIESSDTGKLELFDNNISEVEAFGEATLITIGSSNGNVILRGDIQVDGGDITTSQNEFNLINTTATVVNFAGAASEINIGGNTGTTTVNNNFDVLQNTVLGVDNDSFTTIRGEITLSLRDNTSTVLNITEASDTYIKVDTTNGNELVTIGATPKVTIQNTTESTSTTTGSVTIAGGVGVVKNLNVGGNVTVSGNTTLGNQRAVDTHQISGRTQIDIPDNDAEAFKLTENTQDYITAVTTDGAEALVLGTTPRVLIGNTTNSTDKDTGAVVIEGGVGIEKNLNVGVDFSAGGNAAVTGDLAVNGGDITTTATTFNLLDDNATTVNAFSDATTINVGASTGTLTVNNTATVFNSTSHIVIPVGDTEQRPDPAVAGMIRYNTELSTFEGYATAWGSLGGVKDVDGNTYIIPETFPGANENILYFYNDGVLTATLDIASFSLLQNTSSSSTTTGTLKVTGGVGISENINVGGTANVTGNTALGGTLAVTGNTTITGDLAVNGGDITSTAATFNLVTGSATVNFATGSTVLEIGSSNGTTNVNNNLVVDKDVSIIGFTPVTVENYAAGTDYTAAGTSWNTNTLTIEDPQGTLITRLTGFVVGSTFSITYYDEDLEETASGTIELATVFGVSGTTYTATTVQTAPTTPVTDISAVAITVIGVGSANLNTTNTVFNLVDSTATTVNFAGAATTLEIGAATGTTNINNNLDVDGNAVIELDLEVRGGDITTDQSVFNLLNTTATTINAFGAATTLEIGAATGTTNINNNLDVDGNAVIDLDLEVRGGDITTNQSVFNLLNTTATTVNFAGAATTLEIGAATGTTNINNDLDVDGDLNLDGGDLTVSTTTFNLANTTATTVNAFGAATTLEIGAATGTTNINNDLDVDGDLNLDGGDLTVSTATFNLANTTATTINAFGAATEINIGFADPLGLTTVKHDLKVNGDFSVDGTLNLGSDVSIAGDLAVNGGDLTTTATTFNLINTNATTVNFAGAATILEIGAATGTTNINNNLDVDGDINFDGSNITTSAVTVNLLPTIATTVNAFAAATSLHLGAATGTTIVKNNFEVDLNTTLNGTLVVDLDATVTGDLAVNGGDLTTNQTTFNLLNATATTVNFAGAATTIEIGAATGTTNINNDLDVDGDINIDGGDLTVSASVFNLANTNATEINAFGTGTAITIGATTGTTTIRNANTVVTGDLAVNGGDLTTNQTTFNLLNATATTLNIGGAATVIEIGAATGTTNINNNLDVDGDINIDGGDLTVSTATFNLANTTATTVNAFGAATTIEIGAATGTTNINNNLDVDGDINIDGGDLTVSTATFNLANTTATTVNFAGAATTIEIGAATGTTNINNNLDVDGDVNIDGGDLTVSTATFNLANTTATTVNFAGAGTSINIGAATGNTTVNNNLIVTGNLTVNGDVTTVNTSTLDVEDINITIAKGAIDSAAANGAGITVDGANALITYLSVGDKWTFNKTVDITGALDVSGNTGIGGTLSVTGNTIFTGDLAVNGGDLTTTATTFNLINANATTVNFAGAATTLEIGAATGTTNINNNLDVDGDVNIDGGDLTASTNTFNLLNSAVTTVNFAGAATLIEIGAATGTTNINNDLDVDGDINIDGGDLTVSTSTFNLANTTATTGNLFGAGTAITIGATTGTTTIRNANTVVTGDLAVNGGDLTTTAATFNLVDATATTVNFARAGTAITIGDTTGTTTIRNANTVVTGDLAVNGGDLTTSAATFNLLNATATTVNFAGAATAIEIGAATGTTNINNNLDVDGNAVIDLDLEVRGGDLTTNQTTFNLLNATATTVNFAGAATTVEIGAATGTTNINNNLDVDGDVNIDGGDLTVSTTTFNLANTTATTGNLFGAGTAITIGATTGTTTIRNANTVITGDLAVNGGDLTTNQTTFNLLNATATTVNAFGAATSIEIGAATGTTNINNNLDVDGDINIDGGDLTASTTTFNLVDTTVTTLNIAGRATAVNLADDATAASTLLFGPTITGNTVKIASTAAGTINLTTDVTSGTVNLFGSVTGTTNIASSGTINLGNNTGATTLVDIGGAITGNTFKISSTTDGTINLTTDVTSGTVNLFNEVTTTGTVNFATGSGVTVNIGGTSSTVNIKELTLTTDLAVQYGGTGVGTFTTNGVVFGNGTDPLLVTAASNPGSNASTSYGILTTDVNNVPVWTDVIDGGSY